MIGIDKHYTDPRLVELYDLQTSGRDDYDFYLGLADEFDAREIVDVGCGTGVLARELAANPDRRVLGIDPAAAMLEFARRQSGAERVEWVEGDAGAVGRREADLVVMTGHVAQVFLSDEAWTATLTAIHDALRPGGRLAFESRNPGDRPWERWNRSQSRTTIDSSAGRVETWVEVTAVEGDLVRFDGHHAFLDSAEDLVYHSTLRFRSLDEITATLVATGYQVENVYGGWDRAQVDDSSREMVFVARRDGQRKI